MFVTFVSLLKIVTSGTVLVSRLAPASVVMSRTAVALNVMGCSEISVTAILTDSVNSTKKTNVRQVFLFCSCCRTVFLFVTEVGRMTWLSLCWARTVSVRMCSSPMLLVVAVMLLFTTVRFVSTSFGVDRLDYVCVLL